MRAYALFALVASSLVGCGNTACKDKTLFVTFSLAGLSGGDGVDLSVSVAGGTPKVSHVSLPGSVTKPSVEIDFPNGYPRGQSVTVDVDVKAGVVLLASGSTTVTLSGGCAAASVTLTPAAVANKHQGDPCGPDDICDTGNCVDGYCCDSPCTGQCQACDVATALGTCTTVSDGTPHGMRAACNGSGTCGGLCDGASATACTYPPTSVICGAACDGHCDAAGGCTSVAGGSCPDGFACGTGGCKTSCTDNTDCQPNFQCMAPNCVRVPESDCLDGKDNNGDGLADCQDPTCTAQVACVPAVPMGDELGILSMSACPTAFPTPEVQHQGLNAPACTTTGCGCDPLVSCQVSFGLSSATDCSSATNFTQTVVEDLVNEPNNNVVPCNTYGGSASSMKLNSITNSGTSCKATGSTTPPAITWMTTSNFCAGSRTSDTCGAQQICAPSPPSGQTACVRIPQAGASCPAGYGGQSATWYAQAVDTRACTCGCNVTQNGACGTNAGLNTQAAASCPIPAQHSACTVVGVGNCSASGGFLCGLSSPVGAFSIAGTGASGAQCASTASTAGTASPAGASTVCCQ